MSSETKRRWKGILIDWPTVADMDTIENKCYSLNQQQVSILLSALSVYKWRTRWHNLDLNKDELESLIGDIEYRLMEECTMSIDYEALTQAIRDGTYQSMNDLAKQVVSGRTANIAVDDTGTVTDPTTGIDPDAELPPDDPLTPTVDENLAAKAGGMINVRKTIQAVFNDLAAWHFGAVPEAQAISRLILLYGLEGPNVDAFVNYWYVVDATPDTPPLLDDELDSYLFCRGLSSQTFAKYSLNFHTPTTDRETLLKFAPCLTDEILNQWYLTGIDTLATDYLGYSCIPIESYSFTIQWGAASINDTRVWKKNHRYLIKATGYLLDTDTDIQDAWWHDQAALAPVFDNVDFNIQQGGATKIRPTQFEVPYRDDHSYSWTLDMGTIDASPQWGIARDATMSAASTSPSGGLLIEIQDLGEIGI